MIVFEGVPLGLGDYVGSSSRVDNNFVLVDLRSEARTVLYTHLVLRLTQKVLTLRIDIVSEPGGVRRIAYALEELDSFFTLQILQLAILLDEILFIDR